MRVSSQENVRESNDRSRNGVLSDVGRSRGIKRRRFSGETEREGERRREKGKGRQRLRVITSKSRLEIISSIVIRDRFIEAKRAFGSLVRGVLVAPD